MMSSLASAPIQIAVPSDIFRLFGVSFFEIRHGLSGVNKSKLFNDGIPGVS